MDGIGFVLKDYFSTNMKYKNDAGKNVENLARTAFI